MNLIQNIKINNFTFNYLADEKKFPDKYLYYNYNNMLLNKLE